MSAYLYGVLTVPVAAVVIFATGWLLTYAWDSWNGLLRRLAPKWYPKESNADLGAVLGTYSGRILRLGGPGFGVFILTEQGNLAPPKIQTRAKWAIWKVMQDGEQTDES